MKDFTALKTAITAAIRANGVGAITGPVLQTQLLAMVDKMELAEFEGIATTATTPVTDALTNHFYIAVATGTYANFGGLVVSAGDTILFYKMAGANAYSNVNLTSGLKSVLTTAINAKQDALTEGNGIEIDESDEISVKVKAGGHITNSADGLDVETTNDASANQGKIATGKAVTDYVSGQKGIANGLAPLDANGLVDKTDLPTDSTFFEETADGGTLVDLYQATLQQAYQAIVDCQTATGNANTLLPQITAAITSANNAASGANTAKTQAESAASSATSAASSANSAASNATSAANSATTAAGSANSAASAATTAASNVTAAGVYAQTQGDYALAKGTAANNAATLANEKAGLADTKAAYAQQKGDYALAKGNEATAACDAAKGEFESMDARFDYDESAIADVVDEVESARGTYADLDARLDASDSSVTSISSEVTTARGGKENLNARLANIESTDLVFQETSDLTTLM